MEKITKSMVTVVKVLMITLLIAGLSSDSFAQKKEKKKKKAKTAKELKRPAATGNSAVDSYAKSAFNIYWKNQAIAKTLTDGQDNIKDAGELKSQLESQLKEVTGLLGKSKAAGDAAAKMPMKDKPKAVKAVKAGTEALNNTKDAIPGQIEMVKKHSK